MIASLKQQLEDALELRNFSPVANHSQHGELHLDKGNELINDTNEGLLLQAQNYRIFLKKISEKRIIAGISERTLRSRFAAELPIKMIRALQALYEKLNNNNYYITPLPISLIQALLDYHHPYNPNFPYLIPTNNNTALNQVMSLGVAPQFLGPKAPIGNANNNTMIHHQLPINAPYDPVMHHQNYAQSPMGINNHQQQRYDPRVYHQSYDLGTGNMVSLGNPNVNNNIPMMNAAPSCYPSVPPAGIHNQMKYNYGVQGHGGFNGVGGATTNAVPVPVLIPISISNNHYNSNVNGFGFMDGAPINNVNVGAFGNNGNYPASIQGCYVPPGFYASPPSPPPPAGYYAPPPRPPATAANNNGIIIDELSAMLMHHAAAQKNSGGIQDKELPPLVESPCDSNEEHSKNATAINEDQSILDDDDYVLFNLLFMLEDMHIYSQRVEKLDGKEFFKPHSSTSSNVVQSPEQVGGNQIPDDFFDFSDSANLIQQGDNEFLDIEISDEMFTTTNNGSAITNLVKTARFKELAPYNPDWYFVRAVFNEPCPISHRLLVFLEVGTRSKVLRASMARKIYLRGGVGVGAFKRIYGGSQRNGSCPPHFCESSGAIARHILQPLESMTVIEGDNKFLDIEISAEMLTTTNNGSAITCNGSAITCNYSVSKQMQRPSLNSCLGIKQTKLRAIKGLLLMRIFT
ncbi:hypothetical protein AHAS_Ahas15G0392000 [Arachis hypogaea]